MNNNLLKKYGFNQEEFEDLQAKYRSGDLSLKTNVINYDNSWEIGLPRAGDTTELPAGDSPAARRGEELITAGRLGMIMMNGGAATRFQKPGESIPKGAFKVMELAGTARSFMEIKLANVRYAEKLYGGSIPVWILNSYFTRDKTVEILEKEDYFNKSDVYTYCQGIMKRVIPSREDLELHYGKALSKLDRRIDSQKNESEIRRLAEEKAALRSTLDSWISRYAGRAGDAIETGDEKDRYNPPGHLDTTLWLILDRSRPLLKMADLGVEYLMIANIDNLGAMVNPALPGLLDLQDKDGARILCEVSEKPPGQKGGALARVHDPERDREWTQLIEEFAFPPDFDQDRIPEFNNAAYTVSVSTLLRLFRLDREQLENLSQEELTRKVKKITDMLPVYVAIKELKREDGSLQPVVQFERLQGDLTRLLRPLGVKTHDRFFPVKKREDIPVVVPRLCKVLAGKLLLN